MVISGKSADNVRYLQLFLSDYAKEFNNTTLNASCKKCIADYLRKYKSKFTIMDNKCDYVLHKKREGMQIEFGSSVFVNNTNITNELAEKLVNKFKSVKGEDFDLGFLFSVFPKETKKEEVVIIETTEEEVAEIVTEQPKKRKRNRKNRN